MTFWEFNCAALQCFTHIIWILHVLSQLPTCTPNILTTQCSCTTTNVIYQITSLQYKTNWNQQYTAVFLSQITSCHSSRFPDFNLLLMSSWIELSFVKVVPKYLNTSTLSKELLSIFILWFHPAFWSRDLTMYLVLSSYKNTNNIQCLHKTSN